MRFFLLLLFGTLLSLPLAPQHQLQGRVISSVDQKKISEANILVFETASGTITNEVGRFTLNNLPSRFTIRVSHIGYADQTISFEAPVDTFLTIELASAVNELERIVVTPYKTPTPVSSTQKMSIRDFSVNENYIFALEYLGNFQDQQISVRNLDGEPIQSIKLKDFKHIRSLHTSCNQDVYLVTRDQAYLIEYKEKELKIGKKITKKEFEEFIEPCKAINAVTIYYQFGTLNGLKQTIRSYDIRDEYVGTLRVIGDKKSIGGFRADVAYNKKHQNSNNLGDIWSEENDMIRRSQTTSDFLVQVLYRPKLPVHVFNHDEELLVFNHPEQTIEFYYYDKLARTIPIDYPLKKSWFKEVFQDPVTQQFYVLFSYGNDTVVKQIDIRTGKTIPVAFLKERPILVQKVRVVDGVLYYTIRDQQRAGNKGLKKINL